MGNSTFRPLGVVRVWLTSPLPSFKIAIAGGNAVLAGRKLIEVHPDAHGAARLAPLAARRPEDLRKPLGHGLPLHFLRARHHQHTHLGAGLAALQQRRRGAQIGDAPVGAASDEEYVDGAPQQRLSAFQCKR